MNRQSAHWGISLPRPGDRVVDAYPMSGIVPVDGWALLQQDEEDSDGFWTTSFVARSERSDKYLDTCRFHFDPSQDRFAWLVRAGFPRRRNGPWTNEQIDAEIAREAEAEAQQVAA